MDNYNFLTKEETIICLTTKESDELEIYGYLVIERAGFMFYVTRGKNSGTITATLINYVVLKSK